MKPQMLSDLKNKAVTQAIETIRNRIDSLGVSEPTIQEHGLGQYQILVQLPGVDDPGRVKDIMQSTAMLEIKQVLGGPYASEQAALQEKGGVLPPDAILMPGHGAPGAGAGDQSWYLVSRVSAVRGKDLRDAQPGTDQNGQPNVRFTLTGEGGQRFFSFTSAHVGESLGVVLDNKVQEVANIKEAIRDTGEISGGSMSQQQAKDLSMILRSGALPAGIKYLEERTVGPSLGHRSARGRRARRPVQLRPAARRPQAGRLLPGPGRPRGRVRLAHRRLLRGRGPRRGPLEPVHQPAHARDCGPYGQAGRDTAGGRPGVRPVPAAADRERERLVQGERAGTAVGLPDPEYADVAPFARRLVETFPDQGAVGRRTGHTRT